MHLIRHSSCRIRQRMCRLSQVKEADKKMTEHEVLELRQQKWNNREQQFSETVDKKDAEKTWKILSRVA